jgi:hypothetical protein
VGGVSRLSRIQSFGSVAVTQCGFTLTQRRWKRLGRSRSKEDEETLNDASFRAIADAAAEGRERERATQLTQRNSLRASVDDQTEETWDRLRLASDTKSSGWLISTGPGSTLGGDAPCPVLVPVPRAPCYYDSVEDVHGIRIVLSSDGRWRAFRPGTE